MIRFSHVEMGYVTFFNPDHNYDLVDATHMKYLRSNNRTLEAEASVLNPWLNLL